MAIDLYGMVGPVRRSAGATGPVRLGDSSEVVVGLAHAKYYEAVVRGNCFHAQTAATGVAPGTAIGTTAAFALYNPQGSGKNLVVLQTSVGYISGTLGAGTLHYVGHISPTQTAFSGTAITARNALIGSSNTGVGLAYTTATVPSGGSGLRTLCSLTALLASTAVAPYPLVDDVDGAIIIAPGGGISIQATAAAGSSPLVVISACWEEVAAL